MFGFLIVLYFGWTGVPEWNWSVMEGYGWGGDGASLGFFGTPFIIALGLAQCLNWSETLLETLDKKPWGEK